MSLPVMVWVLDHSEATLGARLVLLALAEHAHDDGTNAFPKVDTLMKRTRLSDRGVREALSVLERDGMIVRTGKRGRTWVFTVLGPFNEPADPAVSMRQILPNIPADSAASIGNQELEPSEDAKASSANGSKPRKRDPIWDALVAIFGEAPQGMGRGRWNAAAKSLRADAATPEQIAAAAERYPRVFAGAVMTPTAIAANWVTLSRARDGPRVTGWRFVRGSHGSTYVPDPEGTDTPPREYR